MEISSTGSVMSKLWVGVRAVLALALAATSLVAMAPTADAAVPTGFSRQLVADNLLTIRNNDVAGKAPEGEPCEF